MEQRLSLVTLAVADLDASRRFYLDGLGWTAAVDVPGEVLMVEVGRHVVLSLWQREHFEAEVGPIAAGDGVAPFTLAHNVATPAEVDAVLDVARSAGADPVSRARERGWAGGPVTSPTPTGIGGRLRTTPVPSDGRCCRERSAEP